MLPYPGGRHPRIGFLEGAIRPQRETKISVFAPWDETSYVVADVPEAIWSNLGLTYLAHTHVPTVWTKAGVALPPLEWTRHADGTLAFERRLPNGIRFGTKVRPTPQAVRMEMWLFNGTSEPLSDLRVQNCVMLKGAAGFVDQTNDNKLFHPPYAACRSTDGRRWIITAWTPCQRAWGNAKCPCLHSDPQFPDCPSGQTDACTAGCRSTRATKSKTSCAASIRPAGVKGSSRVLLRGCVPRVLFRSAFVGVCLTEANSARKLRKLTTPFQCGFISPGG